MIDPSKSNTLLLRRPSWLCGYDLSLGHSINDQEEDGADVGDENTAEVERLEPSRDR